MQDKNGMPVDVGGQLTRGNHILLNTSEYNVAPRIKKTKKRCQCHLLTSYTNTPEYFHKKIE